MMNQSIKQILSKVYELEGLLLLAENHGSDTDMMVYNLIDDKSKEISELSQHIGPQIFDKAQQSFNGPTKVENNIPTFDSKQMEMDAKNMMDDDFGPMPKYEMLGADSCCDVDDEETEEEPSADENPDHLEEDEPTEIWSADFNEPQKLVDNDIVPEKQECDISKEAPIEEESSEDEESDIEEDDSQDLEEDDDIEEDDGENDVDDVEDEKLTLDDALQRHISKNLKQAFSLNDKFRYRRELFGNSDVEMTNTLNLVETMNSYSEAEDYFYGDLEWDKNSPEVMDFMKIIRNHFA